MLYYITVLNILQQFRIMNTFKLVIANRNLIKEEQTFGTLVKKLLGIPQFHVRVHCTSLSCAFNFTFLLMSNQP